MLNPSFRAAWVLLVCLIPLSSPRAAPPPTPPGPCEVAIRAADKGMQPGLLPAIGMVESGRVDPATGRLAPWPWTINVQGQGHFYASKQEAIAAVQALRAGGADSIDVGCMQVNLRHHPDAFASLDAAFEPTTNVAYAAGFLGRLYRQTGGWDKAAAAYHSFTPERGTAYQARVLAAMAPAQRPAGWLPPAAPAVSHPNRTDAFNQMLAGNEAARSSLLARIRGTPAKLPGAVRLAQRGF